MNGPLLIESIAQVEEHAATVRASATHLQQQIAAFRGDGLELLRALKFDAFGRHPIQSHDLNAIEQVNQVWTHLVALAAVRQLLQLHPDAGGFLVAPGAHASQDLDIMSVVDGLVGAETFAAVTPRNNGKLAKDLDKLAIRRQRHLYVFFTSPEFSGTLRLPHFERDGIQVWSVEV